MKKIGFFLLSASLLFSACTKSIRGSGSTITETRNIAAITSVQLEGSAEVEIMQGNVQSVTVSGYENLVPIFVTQVNNGNLLLRFEDPYYNVRRNNIKVTIVVPDIQAVRSNGSGQISISNFLNKTIFNASINGSGNINMNNSSFIKMILDVNGSGNIKAYGCTAADTEAEIHGSGNIEITCTNKISAHIYGSGNIDYWGNPVATDVQISGSGRVRKR
ncbi:MAG: DUF2807 domain-containing protein [Chitinophagaceae bacterium]|nr:MAG: DUF2807 domain-containing protein [Chitinophagaceae bacterium]